MRLDINTVATSADWLVERVLKDRPRPGHFTIAVDVSGATPFHLIDPMIDMTREALARRGYPTVRLVSFAARVVNVMTELHVDEPLPTFSEAFGGTIFDCLLDFLMPPGSEKKPHGLIVVTDGYISIRDSERRKCERLPALGWLLTGTENCDYLEAIAPAQYGFDERTLLLGNGPSVNLWETA